MPDVPIEVMVPGRGVVDAVAECTFVYGETSVGIPDHYELELLVEVTKPADADDIVLDLDLLTEEQVCEVLAMAKELDDEAAGEARIARYEFERGTW